MEAIFFPEHQLENQGMTTDSFSSAYDALTLNNDLSDALEFISEDRGRATSSTGGSTLRAIIDHNDQLLASEAPLVDEDESRTMTELVRGGVHTQVHRRPRAVVEVCNFQPSSLRRPAMRPPNPHHWANVYYYELDVKVGEAFKANAGDELFVDGYFSTSEPNRFCLGPLGSAKRDSSVVNVRQSIGRGVVLRRTAEGVVLRSLSAAPIFVQSPMYAVQNHDHPATVYRMTGDAQGNGMELEVFNNAYFEKILNDTRQYGYGKVYALQKMCHVRLSFAKGWGAHYNRRTITATPCWIEIHFIHPLSYLDHVLCSLDPPSHDTSGRGL